MIFWIAPAFKLAPYVLGGLDFLRRQLFPPATGTSNASTYVPPFTGGQCQGVNYRFRVDYQQGSMPATDFRRNIAGAIGQPVFRNNDGISDNWDIPTGQGNIGYRSSIKPIISEVSREDLALDNCGNVLDPTGGTPIASDGIATSAPPNLDSAPIVIEAVPPVVLPSFAAALAAALAAARNALDALDAIKAVARAIEALSDLLNKKNNEENKKEKEKKESQDTIRYEFGSIQKDGFLRLYPDSNLVKYVAQQLDISFITIPSYLGKYFGKFSPNYYRHKPTSNLISSLGYISFVSPTFGVLSTHHLEFRRTSIKVPENSIGFYYHLGLDGALTANAFAFYTKPKP